MKQEGEELDKPQCMESPVSCHVGIRSLHCLCIFVAHFKVPSGWLMSHLALFVCLSSNVF